MICVVCYIVIFRCKIPQCDDYGDILYEPAWINDAIPLKNGVPEQCLRFSMTNEFNDTSHTSCTANIFNRSRIIRCNEFVYKTDEVNLVNEVFCCEIYLK